MTLSTKFLPSYGRDFHPRAVVRAIISVTSARMLLMDRAMSRLRWRMASAAGPPGGSPGVSAPAFAGLTPGCVPGVAGPSSPQPPSNEVVASATRRRVVGHRHRMRVLLPIAGRRTLPRRP